MQDFHNAIRSMPLNTAKLGKLTYIGKLMKYFYLLHDSAEIENILEFSFGFHGYIDNIIGINKNIVSKKLNGLMNHLHFFLFLVFIIYLLLLYN